MRKITACEFMTLDGVIQNEENDGDGFTHGGWFFPFADEVTGSVMQERLAKPVDLLLGRKTFDGWEGYWPTHSNFWPNCMTATKYVASNTRTSSDWEPTVFLSGDLAEKVAELKRTDGPDIHIMGSACSRTAPFRLRSGLLMPKSPQKALSSQPTNATAT